MKADAETLFRSTGSYEPDPDGVRYILKAQKFRSTGSYEPDLISFRVILTENCFDPQALTSLTNATNTGEKYFFCFDPQALTSLTQRG